MFSLCQDKHPPVEREGGGGEGEYSVYVCV